MWLFFFVALRELFLLDLALCLDASLTTLTRHCSLFLSGLFLLSTTQASASHTMAAAVAPVELPTGRRSYYHKAPAPQDIHDPNWIPVLDGVDFKPLQPSLEKEVASYPPVNFSLFPAQATSPKQRPAISHNYSKSSLAPESVASESDSRSSQRTGDGPAGQEGAAESVRGDGGGEDAGSGHDKRESSSVVLASEGQEGTLTDVDSASSVPDDGVNPSADPRPVKDDPQAAPNVMSPTVSTASSSRRTTVMPPTSKYNRKPVPSIPLTVTRPSAVPSLAQTPHESPHLGATVATGPMLASLTQPVPSPRASPDPVPSPESTAKVQPTKSSASERRQRALHSHPSNISMRSTAESLPNETQIVPKPPSVRHKALKSTDSRATTSRCTIYDAPTPSPAPTTPLPQLPPQARRASTIREGGAVQKPIQVPAEAHLPSPATPASKASEHAEMASFMTTKNTVLFRRFDDVHVRLLLCLQDEISQLEKELLRLESPTSSGTQADKTVQRTKILQELRRVVAEYGTSSESSTQMQIRR